MVYRRAKSDEWEIIAKLHAVSWQSAYKDILSKKYLKYDVVNDRLAVWQARFNTPKDNEYICVAEEEGSILGFVCVYGNDNAQWGSLVDNLHVLPHLKGEGIGRQLMAEAAKWVIIHYPDNALYLWVYEKNVTARQFYEKLGGKNVESHVHDNPGGGTSNALRYTWADLSILIGK
jgi:GNAT superfamily N-acetyltransferase